MRTCAFNPMLAIFLSLGLSGSLHAEDLSDVVKETVKSNPDVLIAGSERDTVKEQMEQARAGFFPQADITVGTGWEYSDNPTTRGGGYGSRNMNRDEAEILVRQLIYDGNGTESEFERNRARVNSRAYDTFSTAEVTGLKAVEAYLNVLKSRKLVELATRNLENHQQTYDRILKRGESGVGSKADVQQALGRLALAKTNLMAEENKRQDAIAAYINVVGSTPMELEEPVPPEQLLPVSMDEAITTALDNHPRLKSAEADVDAAREQHEAAKSLFYPRVHLELSGSNNDNLDGISGTNKDAQAMIRGRYNFTGGKDIARRQETVYQLDQAKEIRARTHRQIIESMRLSWHSYETAKSQLEYFKTHVDASKQALIAYRKQFIIGQRTLIDLLDQENEVFQANINYVNGLFTLAFSTYRILAGTGKLLWSLDVELPKQASTIQ
ncbi:MAG TPA: TolC family outer membrane protein [Gammaproteobacteria bacterium]|nr:TolC family outer membrane protein [Gammaproteobacteria bacterium]